LRLRIRWRGSELSCRAVRARRRRDERRDRLGRVRVRRQTRSHARDGSWIDGVGGRRRRREPEPHHTQGHDDDPDENIHHELGGTETRRDTPVRSRRRGVRAQRPIDLREEGAHTRTRFGSFFRCHVLAFSHVTNRSAVSRPKNTPRRWKCRYGPFFQSSPIPTNSHTDERAATLDRSRTEAPSRDFVVRRDEQLHPRARATARLPSNVGGVVVLLRISALSLPRTAWPPGRRR